MAQKKVKKKFGLIHPQLSRLSIIIRKGYKSNFFASTQILAKNAIKSIIIRHLTAFLEMFSDFIEACLSKYCALKLTFLSKKYLTSV